MIPTSDDSAQGNQAHASIDALDTLVEGLQADGDSQNDVPFEKRLSSYFSDPYRSPTHSATSSPVGSISAASGRSWRDHSSTVSSPSSSTRRGLIGDRRSSTLRMSRMCSFSEFGEFKEETEQSGLVGRDTSPHREMYSGQKEEKVRDDGARQSLKSPLISITLPSSTRLASLASSSSLSNLLALSTSSGLFDTRFTNDAQPSTPPPTIPLPVLPRSNHGSVRPSNDKRRRRRIKLRSPREREREPAGLSGWQIPQAAGTTEASSDASTGQTRDTVAGGSPTLYSTERLDGWAQADCSPAIPSIHTTPASSTAPQFPVEVFSPNLLAPFGASEVTDPSAPTMNIPVHLPGDDTFGDLAGRLRTLGELVGSGSDGSDGQRKGLVLEFPLPPARSLPPSPEPESTKSSFSRWGALPPSPLPLRSLSATLSPAASVQPAELRVEALAISPTKVANFKALSLQRSASPDWDWDIRRKGSLTSETSLMSESDEGFYGTTTEGERSRFSGSSFASVPSTAPVTPKAHLHHLRSDGRTSVDLASEAADEMESLIDGDIRQLLNCAERDVRGAATHPARFQVPGSTWGLAPPGPDSAYWGEPEIVLADIGRSTGIGQYKGRQSAAKGSITNLASHSSTSVPARQSLKMPRFTLRKRSVNAPGHNVRDPAQAVPGKWAPSRESNTVNKAATNPLDLDRPDSVPSEGSSGHSLHTVSGNSTILKMAAILPFGAIVSRTRAAAAIQVGRTLAKGVNRVGTAVAAAQYARPALARLTEKSESNYKGHLPLNWFENAFLAGGSAVIGVADTKRGDLVALLSETSSQSFMPRLHGNMSCEPEGRQILRDRPLISSKTIDLIKLKSLRRGTLGREWVEWLEQGGVTPDTRHEVTHIDSPTLAYTMTRYRQTHDLYHTLFSLPPTLPYELTLKVLELSNMSLPVAGLSSAFGPLRMTAGRRQVWREDWVPWALRQGTLAPPLVGIYWEKRWEQGLADLRQELGVARMNNGGVISRWKSYREIRETEKALRRSGEWIDEPED